MKKAGVRNGDGGRCDERTREVQTVTDKKENRIRIDHSVSVCVVVYFVVIE